MIETGKTYSHKEIQIRILNIVKYFDVFCKKHDIKYYLMGGTALGAMRHKGFIPWDDDFDVFMDQKNYKKFIQISKRFLNSKFYLQEENTRNWPLFLSQLCENNTTFIDSRWQENRLQHHGLFIDVMCMYNSPKNTFLRYLQYTLAMFLKAFALNKIGYKPKGFFKQLFLVSSYYIVKLLSKQYILNLITFPDTNTYYSHFFGAARFKNNSFSKSLIGKARLVDFEDMKLPVMEHVEEYLEIRYGETWAELPSQKTKDKYASHGEFIDLDVDYKNYLIK
jgi:lipopolysaccharide cholinephosphotransferase